MILRVWRARASRDNPEGYPRHFRTNLAAELRSVDGFLGAQLFRQNRPDGVEFLVHTRWRSIEAIRAFAGDDIGRAVVEPGAIAVLIDYDERVQHNTLVEEVGARPDEDAA
jgi:heme-degrading monooxygenase HmoA